MQNRARIVRLFRYRNVARRLKSLKYIRVFSENLADAVGVTSAQVRKDFSLFGVSGNRRGGYNVEEVIKQIEMVLGKGKLQKVILVGFGNIGRSLLRYPGFKKDGIKIAAAFDIDPAKVSREGHIPVLPLSEMGNYVDNNKIQIGIITVPDYAAQQVFELMKSAGIKGILNFAPICLQESEECIVNNINLETELESIIYYASTRKKRKPKQ
ncbi:MAG: redox-sensing transcriptional repressor Rex [Planctomycetes bacterium RBG_19FT_COMBO_48_8]|nr:MAG: redox-sensing transcriptional repressor Rex [Planctomycetes bacterium RBG_19FT_COMBO_48_8]